MLIPEGGELHEDDAAVRARMLPALQSCLDVLRAGETGVVVTHGACLKVAVVALLKRMSSAPALSLVRVAGRYGCPIAWPLANVHQFPVMRIGSGVGSAAMYHVGRPCASYM